VLVTSKPTSDSDIRIELFTPIGSAWNGKFLQLGNGGFAGVIPTDQLKTAAIQGYAAVGTDDGHDNSVIPAGQTWASLEQKWALGHPEKMIDWSWRGAKEATDTAKVLIIAQKGIAPKRSYFFGCSGGGREGMIQAQRFPKAFDGIVSGAPGTYSGELVGYFVKIYQAKIRPGGYLNLANLRLLESTALRSCGGPKYVTEPASCRVDLEKLQCRGATNEQCLTAPQIATARLLYDGWRDPRTGRLLYPGYTPGGEAESPGIFGWHMGDSPEAMTGAAAFATQVFRYMSFGDPQLDVRSLDDAKIQEGSRRFSAIMSPNNPDLAPFRANGGKLIHYHGWSDPILSANNSVMYHRSVVEKLGNADNFYKLYMVPGMLHCAGGPSPHNVDWLALLDKWVDGGSSPNAVTATAAHKGTGETQVLQPFGS